MPHERVLLDTNVVIALFAGHPAVAERLSRKAAVFLPVPVLGELYRGAYGSSRQAENLKKLEQFASAVALLVCDGETAKRYGAIKHALLGKGRPIPENDMWIAGLAAQHHVSVMTRDQHFKNLQDVTVEFVEP